MCHRQQKYIDYVYDSNRTCQITPYQSETSILSVDGVLREDNFVVVQVVPWLQFNRVNLKNLFCKNEEYAPITYVSQTPKVRKLLLRF